MPAPLHAKHSRFDGLRPSGSLCAAAAFASSSIPIPLIFPVPSHAKHRTPPLPAQEEHTSGSDFIPATRAAPTAVTTAPPIRTSCISAGSAAWQVCLASRGWEGIRRAGWRLAALEWSVGSHGGGPDGTRGPVSALLRSIADG